MIVGMVRDNVGWAWLTLSRALFITLTGSRAACKCPTLICTFITLIFGLSSRRSLAGLIWVCLICCRLVNCLFHFTFAFVMFPISIIYHLQLNVCFSSFISFFEVHSKIVTFAFILYLCVSLIS